MKKAELEELVKEQKAHIAHLEESLDNMVTESMAMGEDLRGRPFMPEDMDGFTVTEIMNKYKTHVEREIFSLDGFNMSRGINNIWFVITPDNWKIPVEINDMFEGITVLRALGLKRITFQGLMESTELMEGLAEGIEEVNEIRDQRLAEEAKQKSNENIENEK